MLAPFPPANSSQPAPHLRHMLQQPIHQCFSLERRQRPWTRPAATMVRLRLCLALALHHLRDQLHLLCMALLAVKDWQLRPLAVRGLIVLARPCALCDAPLRGVDGLHVYMRVARGNVRLLTLTRGTCRK